ncbi:MarR family transcriptional regulator [Eubacteriaceae bacterium ES3]|nr:MarR family transcriptional regulator [Eubacteriaceae bacterium ES3]
MSDGMEGLFLDLIDKIKVILSSDIWVNESLNCSKNEVYVMLYLYRNSAVNMTELSDYLEVPLNTATGIISRMEKHELIKREKSATDKRVVTIGLTETGFKTVKAILKDYMGIGELILESFTDEETLILVKLVDKVVRIVETKSPDEAGLAVESN